MPQEVAPRRRHLRLLAGAVLMGMMLPVAAASPASAEDPTFVGWSDALPGWPGAYAPTAAQECRTGHIMCVHRAIDDMQRRFEPLASSCSHHAIFALSYLRTTEEYLQTALEDGFYRDPAFVNHEDAVFAEYYFDAYDRWSERRTGALPPAWQIAFDAAEHKRVSGSGNLMLGINAHVQRDLPFVLAGIGLVAPDGSSRKADHDKVNQMLNRVTDRLLKEAAARFDPSMDDTWTPYGLSYTVLMQALATWREQAWRNAERLVLARDDTERARVAQSIEDAAARQATLFVSQYSYLPPLTTSAARDAYCATRN